MNRGRCAVVVRQEHLIAVVATSLIGCAILLVGCAGAGSGAATEEQQQGHAEATSQEQGRSPEATAAEARCEGTRTFKLTFHEAMDVQGYGFPGIYTTNDVPSCPSDGLLSGTEGPDKLDGLKGEDEIRGLGGADVIFGGADNDVIYGGPGNERLLVGGEGDDVIYGGDGDDDFYSGDEGKDTLYGGAGDDLLVATMDGQKDKLNCGEGADHYDADKGDYVSISCEEKQKRSPIP
jgi:hypothetical protein